MKILIKHQDTYSRGELLLRTFFGWLYIAIPHGIILGILGFASAFVTFIAFWAVLFTGKYPRGMWDFMMNLQRWQLRVQARLMNLADGYPAFGMTSKDENTEIDMEYPEKLSQGLLLLRMFFGYIYVMIPHGIVLMFRFIGLYFVILIAWFAVLFTGKYPEGMFNFAAGTMRWMIRVNLYMNFLTDTYPPFHGKEEVE
jgi:hypothetical protein